MNNIYLQNEEKAVFTLRSLYRKYGYMQYNMSKFEEYDFYIKNKNFLVSDNIITFTDTDGKLMALKPDVTLSIIKNMKRKTDGVYKVCYDENVYRVAKSTHSFKEIMQAGLECIGDIDDYTIYEVLMLAAESMAAISRDYVLDISHLGILSYVIDSAVESSVVKKQVLKCIGEKNISGLNGIEQAQNVDLSTVKQLTKSYGKLNTVLPTLNKFECTDEVESLVKTVKELEENGYKVHIDFSIVSDTNYYNGFVFRGFIKGIPSSVLSGGQYDNLMSKMNREEKAIGFAVYLDLLERLSGEKQIYDVDTVILYGENTDIKTINNAVKKFSEKNSTVTVQKTLPEKIRYRQLVKLTEKGVEILENNA